MSQTYYLVDNNALIALSAAQRSSKFFRSRCRIPTEVLHEARFLRNHSTLETLAYPVTPTVLEHVRAIMQMISVGAVDLVDLFKSTGAADPLLIASALDATDHNEGSLFPYTWVVVTNDRAAHELANSLEIETIRPSELARLIDASGDPP